MESTARFELPFIIPGQAQKELFHNEALQTIDALLCACVEDEPLAVPPSDPQPGQAFIVASAPSGAWAGHAGALAAWTAGGWRFIAPVEGMTVFIRSSGLFAVHSAGGWGTGAVQARTLSVGGQQVVGARQAAIADPAGGAQPDGEARQTIVAVLNALRAHGLIAT